MLEDAHYKYVISDSKLGTIENEKKPEIEDLKDKVCGLGLSCDFMDTECGLCLCGSNHQICSLMQWWQKPLEIA